MSDLARLYTPAEAGAVSGLNLKAVHNAIDKRIIDPVVHPRVQTKDAARKASRYLTKEDLVRLCVWRGVGDTLSAERRLRLFTAIAEKPTAKTVRADDFLIVDIGEARKQIGKGLRDLEAAEDLVVKDRGILGAEPVFKGTRVPVYSIVSMLAAGVSREEVLAGYPSLKPRMLELGRIWATAHPRRGRPKTLSDLGLSLVNTKRVSRRGDPLAERQAAAAKG